MIVNKAVKKLFDITDDSAAIMIKISMKNIIGVLCNAKDAAHFGIADDTLNMNKHFDAFKECVDGIDLLETAIDNIFELEAIVDDSMGPVNLEVLESIKEERTKQEKQQTYATPPTQKELDLVKLQVHDLFSGSPRLAKYLRTGNINEDNN